MHYLSKQGILQCLADENIVYFMGFTMFRDFRSYFRSFVVRDSLVTFTAVITYMYGYMIKWYNGTVVQIM